MLNRLILAALAIVPTTLVASAVEVTIGGASINLPPPGGFCELREANPSDKRMITTLTGLLEKSGNKLLGMSADCQQLRDWRTGKRQLLDDYAQYQTPIGSMDKPPSETVAQTCKTLRDEGNKILANQMPDIKARVESTLSKIKMNETRFIGVLAEDPNACYAGLIQKIHTEANTDKTQITVFAITIIKNKSVFSYHFSVYQNPQTADAVLGKLKADVAAMIAANGVAVHPPVASVPTPQPVRPASSTPESTAKPQITTATTKPALQPAIAPRPQVATASPLSPSIASSDRRIALVIGNSGYANAPALPNPRRDAESVAAALRRVGFQTVTLESDLGRDKFINALRNFASQAENSDWALIYFAGHGVEMDGMNYLIPVDASFKTDRDVTFEAIPLDQLLTAVDGAKKLHLVVLDACRNNPFLNQMRRTVASRSIGRGLASVEPEAGTLVVYAAKHGQVALDGDAHNSPFVTALVNRITTPGLEVRRLFDLVRDDVIASTKHKQQPFSYGSVSGSQDFYFVTR